MDELLTLNDGTEIAGHCIEVGSRLLLYMYNITLLDAVIALSDEERVRRIEWRRNGQEGAAEGYTTLISASVEKRGQMICASLAK